MKGEIHPSVCLSVCLSVLLSCHSYLSGGIVSFSLVKVDHETPFHQMVAKHQPALHTRETGTHSLRMKATTFTTANQSLVPF